MTQKKQHSFEIIWLLSLLEEAQISMDNIQGSPMYKQWFKNALNGFDRALDKLYQQEQLKVFYLKENGADSTEVIRKNLDIVKQEFLKAINNA